MGSQAPNLPLMRATSDYGQDEAAMVQYRKDGEARARALGNRGPIRLDADGNLDRSILDAYSRCGFYIFEGVAGPDEREDIERDVRDMLERAPVKPKAPFDSQGRPAIGADCKAPTVQWTRPLADPVGGTELANGRYPAKMNEPTPPDGAPEHIVQLVLGSLQFSDACLRLYGHPGLLKVVEAVNGADFTPFNDGVWVKHPGLGGSVAWHQDGTTHWDSPDLDEGTHGFNFMMQLYGCNSENGLWVIPGSHALGKADIRAMVEGAGSDRLPDAVPILCEPGDVAICNRQAVHGSFANTSRDVRVTINFGFHRRKSVLGVEGGGIHNKVTTYDAARIKERSRIIGYAIDARRQKYPDETPFIYKPFEGQEEKYCWNDDARATMKDYNLLDLGI